MTYRERIASPGPKRMLALDGGGIRGVISLEVLAGLERELRRHTGRPALVLADYFDYIAGTSTGAIIAACLSLGAEVERLLALYTERGAEMFQKAALRSRTRYRYRHDPIERILKLEVGEDTTLGSDRLRTLLLIVLRNATTDSPWPVSNNPHAIFNDPALPDCNLDLPLWQLVRASTAAPVYFAPEKVRLGETDFVFVDGAVTPYNNPALQLFVMATAPAFRLGWATGRDELLLVSVGTGNTAQARPDLDPSKMHLLYQAAASIGALLGSAAVQQDLMCRLLGDCRYGPVIDLEVGDARGGAIVDDPLLSYVRYDVDLTRAALDDLELRDIGLHQVLPMDAVEHVGSLRRVGRAVAERCVDLAHLDGFLPPARSTQSTERGRTLGTAK
jgi:predicted acylesterase/phospholipase RssA